MDKFLGVGLVNLLGISLFVIIFIVILKVVTLKNKVPGVTEVVAII